MSLVQHFQISMHMLRMTRELANSRLLTFVVSERVSLTTIPSHVSSSRFRIQARADQT